MRASTPEKAFLRFLYLLDEHCSSLSQSTEFLYDDVVRMMCEMDPEEEYGFRYLFGGDSKARAIGSNNFLALAKFRVTEDDQIRVEITELGRGLGSQLSFPDELEERLRALFKEEE